MRRRGLHERSQSRLARAVGSSLCMGLGLCFACAGEPGTSEPERSPVRLSASATADPAANAPGADRGADESAYRLPAAPRVVAIGDVHGDVHATRRALRLAGALGPDDHWAGGDLVVVQVGDQLDRGDTERDVLELLERLAAEARRAGGALHVLLGNHELMNAMLDFRYVTPAGFSAFAAPTEAESAGAVRSVLEGLPPFARGRALAFGPGGAWAQRLAAHPTVLVVGDTLFVHGGLTPRFARRGLVALNRPVSSWLSGRSPRPPADLLGPDGPVWSRQFAAAPQPRDCEALAESLRRMNVRRMVVAHTVQERGVTAYCDERVWAVDVGLAAFYGGPTEALELRGEATRVLR